FQRYIRRCGELAPPHPKLRELMELTASTEHWAKAIIGAQVIVEGVALTQFNNYRKSATDPNLQEALGLILRDESRHVAFGHLFLQRAVEADDQLASEV